MRVMVFVKATEDSKKGVDFTDPEMLKMMEAMGAFNDELEKAGIMVTCGGLTETSKGKRVAFDGAGRTVIDGPFPHTRSLDTGFWIWDVKDMDEAVEWVKKCPNPMRGPSEIEIRPFHELGHPQ